MPEQLALNQAGGEGGAIHLDQGLAASRAEIVQGPRHQLLAGARFADDQHRCVGGGHGFNCLEYPRDRGALPDDFLEIVLAFDFVLEITVLLFQSGAQPSDLLIRQHVLDCEHDLLTDLLEEPDILRRVLIRGRTPQEERPEGPAPRDERNNHVGANPTGQEHLIRSKLPLGFQVPSEKGLAVIQHPARPGAVAANLGLHVVDVTGQRRSFQRERLEDVLLRIVERQHGAIERNDLVEGLRNRMEESIPCEVRDYRVVNLQEHAIPLARRVRLGEGRFDARRDISPVGYHV